MFTHLRRLLFGVVACLIVVHGQTGFATLAPLARITRLAAGEGSFAFALRQDGVILGWGANTNGTLGKSHHCPRVWAWGSNNRNNLGNPSVVGPSNVPVAVSILGPRSVTETARTASGSSGSADSIESACIDTALQMPPVPAQSE